MLKKGFSLSELLITLGVLGIVAALTVPGVVSKWKERHYETAFKKAMTILTQSNQMILYNALNKASGDNLIFLCGQNYVNECILSVHHLNYNKEYDLYQTRDPIGFKLSQIVHDSSEGDYYKVMVDVDGINGPNKDCEDRFYVKVDKDGQVYDLKICQNKTTNVTTVSTSSSTPSTSSTTTTTTTPTTNTNTNSSPAASTPASTPATFNPDTNMYDGIKCHSTLDTGYGTCQSKNVKDFSVDAEDIVVTNGGSGVSSDGKRMTYEMAEKMCKDKGMRLPEVLELNSMYNAAKDGQISDFVTHEYWAHNPNCSSSDPYNCHNCYMGRGNCGRAYNTTLNNVRCVK